ncbi:MAG: hypothetical protein WBN64_01210 [Candidatus Deferrimicrobium sp.]
MTQIAVIDDPRGRAKIATGSVLFLCILLFLNYGVAKLSELLAYQMWPRDVDMVVFIVTGLAVLYVVLMALPFMPGIEVGLMLMAMLGVGGIVLVYLCTVLALSLSFLAGRLLPPRYVARALGWLRLERARKLVTDLEPLDAEERFRFLAQSTPSRVVPILLRHRYLVLAILFNLPGNAIIGDGGGIALIAGMSRLFPFPRFVLLICLAITPVPLLFLLRAAQQ